MNLNFNQSAPLIDAHVKKCKLHTEANNCCHAVIHRLEHSRCKRCNTACERLKSISVLAGQRQKELSQLCSRLKERWLRFQSNRSFLVTQPMTIAMEEINYVMDAGSIDCIDNDADYLESSYGGCSGDYYGYHNGSEQTLR